MSDASIEFASLLCSRLCHELLDPISALDNGFQLLTAESDPEVRRHCLALLAESARVSADKLKFFRLAFGAGGPGSEIDAGDVLRAIEGVFGGVDGKVAIGWHVTERALPKPAAKLLLNLAWIAGSALADGGRIDIGAEGDEVVVRAEGARVVADAASIAILAGGSAEAPNPHTISAWLVRQIVEQQGGRVQVGEQDDVLLFGASLSGPTVETIVT